MIRNMEELQKAAIAKGIKKVSVAAAHDEGALSAVKMAYDAGLAEAILVGDKEKIQEMLPETRLPEDIEIVDVKDAAEAAKEAVRLVHDGRADMVLKGLVNTSDFLRGVLNKECGLRTDQRLCHTAVLEIPGYDKLLFTSDGGMNVLPDVETKISIIRSNVAALQALGVERPKVAVLTANENVDPNMPATVDAAEIVKRLKEEDFPAIVEGPIAMDVALDPEMAAHKHIESQISGDPDLLIFPNIEAGNIFGKSMVHFAGARACGAILGTAAPVVMISRASTPDEKLCSIALGCAISG